VFDDQIGLMREHGQLETGGEQADYAVANNFFQRRVKRAEPAARIDEPQAIKNPACGGVTFFSWCPMLCTAFLNSVNGSLSRTRTYDPVINSHLLYRLSYQGTR
jgi:hypothetical protein